MRVSAIDDDDRYTGLDRFGRVDDQWYLNTSTSTTLDRLQYGYDRDGNVLYQNNLVNGSFSELYHANSATSGDNNTAYDPLNRLTTFRRGTLTSSGNNGTGLDTITTANLNSTTGVPNQNSWSLDALGNWTSGAGVSNSFNSQNEETANGSSILTFDHNGNMTTDPAGNLYTFDAWNNLIRIANSSNSTLEVFQYDAQGRAVVNNNGSGVEARYYDGSNIIQEQFGTTYIQFVRGLAYVNEVILRDRNADGNGSTGNLGITGSGMEEREYEQHDTQFSAISLTDSTGSVIQRYAYDPYGTTTMLHANWTFDTSGGGTNYWLYTFQGMRIVDAPGISGLQFSQTRIYDANLGRWISQDPAGYVDGSDTYQFVRSNPVVRVDPSGQESVPSGPYTQYWQDPPPNHVIPPLPNQEPPPDPPILVPPGTTAGWTQQQRDAYYSQLYNKTDKTVPFDRFAAEQELQEMIVIGTEWNKRSPRWSFGTNECYDQALALSRYLQKNFTPYHWSLRPNGGSKWHGARNHNVVQLSPGTPGLPAYYLDPFKYWQPDEFLHYGYWSDFKSEYPGPSAGS